MIQPQKNNLNILQGNLINSDAQTLVNTINCVGVMGKGIALQFKEKFPEMYKDYLNRCKNGEVKLGQPYLYKPLIGKWILNFPTKDHWRSVSSIEDIVKGLEYLTGHYKEWGITSIAFPPLGCGQGQLDWKVVGHVLCKYLSKLDIPVFLYAPYEIPQEQLNPDYLLSTPGEKVGLHNYPSKEWLKPAWVALVEMLRLLENERYHRPIGRVIFQKLAYISTAEGLPTGLVFRKGSYGPYSDEVKAITTKLVNHGLLSEDRLGKMLPIKVGHTYEQTKGSYADYLSEWKPKIEKIVDLFARLNTEQAEIVSTVIFVSKSLEEKKKQHPDEMEILEEVMQWKLKRKPPLDTYEVAYTIRNLNALGWLNAKPSNNLPLGEDALAVA